MPQTPFKNIFNKCNIITDKNQHKHLVQIKLTAPKLNAFIKTHYDDKSIRPVINNIQAPSYISLPNILITDLTNS